MSWEGVSPELAAKIEEACTPKQVQVLQMIARGYGISRIARVLDCDRKNVKELRDRARRNLKDIDLSGFA